MRLPNNYGGILYLGKKRRRPYAVRITTGWDEKKRQKFKYLGYFETRVEALNCLADFNRNPYDVNARKMTLEEVWNEWSKGHEKKVSRSSMNIYRSAYNRMERLHRSQFSELRASHFQSVVDNCNSYSSARMVAIVAGLLYGHAMKNEVVDKDYSEFIDLPKKEKNKKKEPFSLEEIEKVWNNQGEKYADMLLILLYSGMRISELLEMKTENIDLERRIMVGGLKTEAGRDRSIPIHKKIIPIIERNIGENFLFQSPRGKALHYSNEGIKVNRYIKELGLSHTVHETRHTFISQCDRIGIDKVLIKRIVGHSTKDITEHYTHKNDDDILGVIDIFEY